MAERYIVLAEAGGVKILDTEDGYADVTPAALLSITGVSNVASSADGTLLAIGRNSSFVGYPAVQVFDTSDWSEIVIADQPPGTPDTNGLKFSPDGNWLGWTGRGDTTNGGRASVYSTSSWVRHHIPWVVGKGDGIRFSRDSTKVAIGYSSGTNVFRRLYNVGTWTEIDLSASTSAYVYDAAFTLGDTHLIFTSNNRVMQFWDLSDLSFYTATGISNQTYAVDVHPVSGIVAAADRNSPYIHVGSIVGNALAFSPISGPALENSFTHSLLFDSSGARCLVAVSNSGETQRAAVYSGDFSTRIYNRVTTDDVVDACWLAEAGAGTGYSLEPNTTTANEGDTVTFAITAPTDDDLYYQITGDITADDIASGTLTGTITITSGSGSLAVELLEDGTLEGSEEFAVELYTDIGLTELVATSDTVTVADTSQGTTLGPVIEINRARRVGLAGVFDLGPARELEAATIEIDVGVALDTAVEENATLLLPAVAVASTAIEVNRAPRMRRARDYGAWLRLPDISRVMLVELDHSDGSKYVANYPYVSYPDDSYPHRSYDDVVRSALDISSQMGGATTFGDLSLANDGALDDWLDLYWAGHEARYYLGEKDWPLEDFLLVARATNAGLGGATTQTMDFDMVETRARLKKPVKTSAANPLALGMIENAPALMTDAATDTYRITEPHSRTIIISVRDSGIPTEDWGDVLASTGLVTLTASPVGLVSFSMLDTLSTVADMVQWVADTLDVPVDAESLGALPEHEVGAFWPPGDNPSGEDVLDTFCSAIGAVWYVDELGYLRAVQLNLPAEEADFEIGPDEIVKGGITLAGMEEPWTGLEVYYSRNFAPLESVSDEASASTNVRNMLVRDWYYSVITTSGANVAQHPNAQRPVMYTALNGSSAAIAMRNHHMSLRTVRRQRWRVDCLLAPALARVGDTVKVTYPALGFESGVNAFVVAVERNLTDAQVTLEVWF